MRPHPIPHVYASSRQIRTRTRSCQPRRRIPVRGLPTLKLNGYPIEISGSPCLPSRASFTSVPPLGFSGPACFGSSLRAGLTASFLFVFRVPAASRRPWSSPPLRSSPSLSPWGICQRDPIGDGVHDVYVYVNRLCGCAWVRVRRGAICGCGLPDVGQVGRSRCRG
ncbi:hypothetical protein DENSPDRAFT_421583 [Dentipellis sp. KUC8613]|nr:hypothetical protein DENSPDRAFT_421583 [Dentipellis sp. KUC8613]